MRAAEGGGVSKLAGFSHHVINDRRNEKFQSLHAGGRPREATRILLKGSDPFWAPQMQA